MPTSIEVRYLTHNDLGKTIQLHGRYAGLTGTLDGLETSRTDHPYILLDLEFERGHKQMYDFRPTDRVTITGQPSPATEDPHGQRYTTPKPIGPRRVPATGPMGDLQDIARAAVEYTTRLAKELRGTVQEWGPGGYISTPQLPPPIHATSHASINPRGEDQGAASGPTELPVGLCGNREDHAPHVHDSKTLGTFKCHADQKRRLPHYLDAASGPRGEDQGAADYGPICCNGDCCGPGSYCCGHPDNKHTHPEARDYHIVAYDNPTTCVRCGKSIDADDNTSCEAPQ